MPTVQDSKENADKCKCQTCPSYTECTRLEMASLFCARGKTECKVPMNGCSCGICPVHATNNLNRGYYCLQ